MAVFFRSIAAKVTAAIIGALLFVVLVNALLVQRFMLRAQFETLRSELMLVAQMATIAIDVDVLLSIPLGPEGMATPQYQLLAGKLDRIKREDPRIAFVYILTKTSRPGIWQFMIDADPLTKRAEGITSFPGDKYDAFRFPEMMNAWERPSADRKLEKDQWGMLLSGYAPLRDKSGRTIAVLGVDMQAREVYAARWQANLRALYVLFAGILIAVLLGMTISRRITRPVEGLAEGVRRIGHGDLGRMVPVIGSDEIAELSAEFNNMVRELNEARKKNSEYFYGVIQSMVRVVEAKDPYTRGHSERVAEYAVKIARRMGLPASDLDTLKHIAVLHDIGKLGIRDTILNKPGQLTPEEWDIMRLHPVTGEEILKPVFLDPLMLEIVRGHHERCDGKGYPDGLGRDRINVMAHILSVADAYDAMTSSRAYRPAPMHMEQAIRELNKGKGSQFDPRVVDLFCKILQEESN